MESSHPPRHLFEHHPLQSQHEYCCQATRALRQGTRETPCCACVCVCVFTASLALPSAAQAPHELHAPLVAAFLQALPDLAALTPPHVAPHTAALLVRVGAQHQPGFAVLAGRLRHVGSLRKLPPRDLALIMAAATWHRLTNRHMWAALLEVREELVNRGGGEAAARGVPKSSRNVHVLHDL